jgi:hypothetical protein
MGSILGLVEDLPSRRYRKKLNIAMVAAPIVSHNQNGVLPGTIKAERPMPISHATFINANFFHGFISQSAAHSARSGASAHARARESGIIGFAGES